MRNICRKVVLISCAAFGLYGHSSCMAMQAEKYSQQQFVNVLNIEKGTEVLPQGFLFSDLGDWHGYGFNDSSDLSLAGGFRGPAFIGTKREGMKWLSDCFEKLSLVAANGKVQPFLRISATEYLPGMLRQELETADLKVMLKEIAVTDRSTMMEYTIANNSSSTQMFKACLEGTLSYRPARLHLKNGILEVDINKGKHGFALSLPKGFIISATDTVAYRAETAEIELGKGETVKFYSFGTFAPCTSLDNTLRIHQAVNKEAVDTYLVDNKKRWNGYLNKILDRPTSYLQQERNRVWAVKALMTLMTNWRSAAGDLKHGGVVPGVNHFDAFWAWDSWEHAAALSVFNPELAKEQMLTMFDYQTPEGMIVDLISIDKGENNIVCSKPPIAGWATYMVYQRTKDLDFVKTMLPKLMKYHEWRYKYRDHDRNGLCEYGGTQPEVYQGQWESGMDVAVKFHGVKMLQNAPGAYSFDQESIELNCYLCAEKFYLAYMCDLTGDKENAERLRREGARLKKTIQEKFFDEETGYFYDIKVGTGEQVKVIDISGWLPLFTNVATPKQAAAVRKNMLDPALFGTYFPFSSLNHQHPDYNPGAGYFRGQTWLNYTYFGIRGFKNYGFMEDAKKYTTLLPDRLKGIADAGIPIRENYHSETGEGLCAAHFSWSSAFSILLLTEDADDFPYVPEN